MFRYEYVKILLAQYAIARKKREMELHKAGEEDSASSVSQFYSSQYNVMISDISKFAKNEKEFLRMRDELERGLHEIDNPPPHMPERLNITLSEEEVERIKSAMSYGMQLTAADGLN